LDIIALADLRALEAGAGGSQVGCRLAGFLPSGINAASIRRQRNGASIKDLNGVVAYVRPVERLTPARKAETAKVRDGST